MEPDSLSVESAFPPPPPLLPPPVPPPVLLLSVSKERASSLSLRRWNDRLALVVGGLTLFLLGIVAGRVFGPDTTSDGFGNAHIAAVSSASLPSEMASVTSRESAAAGEEVNPPELMIFEEPTEPIATPEVSSPAAAASTVVASEPIATASTPRLAEQTATTSPSNPETAIVDSHVPPAAVPQASPVSLEGRVPTIKPLVATQVCEVAKNFQDRKLNTALTWAESVQEANEQAEEKEKLVFLIHVSGNFEMPGFT
jgi:hypothetical protein